MGIMNLAFGSSRNVTITNSNVHISCALKAFTTELLTTFFTKKKNRWKFLISPLNWEKVASLLFLTHYILTSGDKKITSRKLLHKSLLFSNWEERDLYWRMNISDSCTADLRHIVARQLLPVHFLLMEKKKEVEQTCYTLNFMRRLAW